MAFAPSGHEMANGWIFAYTLSGGNFSRTAIFNSTPYGTGGGIWGSGAGPASDGTYIYAVTGNGTFDVGRSPILGPDIGDSLLKFYPPNLTVVDYYTPSDNSTFGGTGRCRNDEDFGSGGVLVFSEAFYLDLNHKLKPFVPLVDPNQ